MILGWQGFSFEHPDDWALSRVNGNRSRGFLALSSSGSVSAQIRWEPKGDPASAVKRYLKSLEKKKSSNRFNTDYISETEVFWKRTGETHGRGIATVLDDGRMIFAEVASESGAQLLHLARSLRASLQTTDLWSVFGLAVHVPPGYDLFRSDFLTARVRLEFRNRGSRLVAMRFGLAAQLLADSSLTKLAKEHFQAPSGEMIDENRFVYDQPPTILRPGVRTILLHEPDQNHILVLQGTSRRLELLPEWEWFASIRNSKPS